MIYSQPKVFEDRVSIAKDMLRDLKITIPTLVDAMDDAAANAFAAWPERIFVADKQGEIAYAGEPGPYGFDPGDAEKALSRLL